MSPMQVTGVRRWSLAGAPPVPDPEPEPTEGWPTVTAANTGVPAGTTLTPTTLGAIGNPTGQSFTGRRFTGGGLQTFTGSGCTFTHCRFEADYVDRGIGNTYIRCEGYKLTAGRTGTRVYDWKHIPTPGYDALGVNSDTYRVTDVVIDGFYSAGTASTLIAGSGNHYDGMQMRGGQDITLRNYWFDQGTTFSTYFNAGVFLENANGGNDNIRLEQGYIRAAGYFALYLYATRMTIDNLVIARDTPAQTKVLYGGWLNELTQSNVRWSDETPLTIADGV